MELPTKLIQSVEAAIHLYGIKELKEAVKRLSDRYRNRLPSLFEKEIDRLAYLCTRLPATYAVIKRVFQERMRPLHSVVDFGAGCGTSIWALPKGTPLHLIEKDQGFIHLGKRLDDHASWQQGDFTQLDKIPKGNVYLFSYSLGEVHSSLYPDLMNQFYKDVGEEIVIIEPGTPRGFECILKLRTLFLKMGAYLIAPCPHQAKCPMEKGNWCHFSQRLTRTPWHRLLKEGERGYEDEKYSYLIVSKKPFRQEKKRILRIPEKRRGHVLFELCTESGVQRIIVSKKEKENYKKLKKFKWGDLF